MLIVYATQDAFITNDPAFTISAKCQRPCIPCHPASSGGQVEVTVIFGLHVAQLIVELVLAILSLVVFVAADLLLVEQWSLKAAEFMYH